MQSSSVQSSSYQSEECCSFNTITEKIPHYFSLSSNALLNQFSDTEFSMLNLSLNNNFITIIQDQLDQLIKQTIIRALATHQSNVNLESSDSSESQKESDQNRFDE